MDVSARDFWFLLAFGAVQAIGITLMTEGALLIPATQVPLIGALEIPFAIFWSWLAFAEVLPTATFLGGTIIVAAIFWHLRAEKDL